MPTRNTSATINQLVFTSQIILVLKLLLLNDEEKSLTTQLMDHLETRNDFPEFWRDCEEQIINPLKRHFPIGEINRAIGVVATNVHEIPQSGCIRGLFPVLSLLSHDCVRNASLRFEPEAPFRVRCRANVDIAAGESVFISYVCPSSATEARKAVLKEGWHFDCHCRRCQDPAELGALSSARRCKMCSNGVKLKASDNVWKCNFGCREENEDEESVSNLETSWESAVSGKDVELLKSLLEEGRRLSLHPNHALLHRMRSWLIPTICRGYGKRSCDFPTETIALKKRLCLESLNVLDVIEPG